MARIGDGASMIRSRADIDASRRMPNARHGSTACSSGVPIALLTVLATLGRSGAGGRTSASLASTPSISAALVNTPVAVSSRSPPHASRNTPPDSRTIRLVAAKSQMPPNTMIDASSVPSATIAASRAKHWLRIDSGRWKSLGTMLRQPSNSPSHGITMVEASASDVLRPHRNGSAAATSNEPSAAYGALHAPSPRTAHQRRPHNGADTIPNSTVPSTSSAMIVPQPGRPSA